MRRRSHFALLGVPVRLRPAAALSGVLAGMLAYVLARLLARGERPSPALGLLGTLTWYDTELAHVIGHIISARMAGAPMSYIRWGFMAMTGYTDHDVTPQQHIGRSLGGPIASGVAALVWWLAHRMLGDTLLGRAAQIAAIQNGLIALGSLLPIPIIDGGVILENLRKLKIEN
jgi:hypothetical protein